MFEPSAAARRSTPGKNVINPLAAIGAMEMLLRQLGEREAADRVDRGIRAATGQMKSMRAGEMGLSTSEVGDLVVAGADGVSVPAASGRTVELYDTTLRDGAQRADLSFTIEDRLRILHRLDAVGFPYVEGGWPGANPRDTEFFKLATKETLAHAQLTAFGMTRKAGERAEDSAVLRELLDAGTGVICLVGKSWDLHVTEALRTTLDEGVPWCATRWRSSIPGTPVFFDAEHFFDGYVANPDFAMAVVARRGGGGGRAAGALRHERRDAPVRRGTHRAGGRPAGVGEARDPRAQRRRLRGGELLDRGGRGRPSGPGHDQRVRRTHRQRRPRPDHRRPRVEDGDDGLRCPRARSDTSPSSRTTSPRSRT